MSRKVYVVQNQQRSNRGILQPKFDLTPAEQFGRLIYLLPPEASQRDPEQVIAKLHEGLVNYTASDYILLIGNTCLIGWTVAIAAYYDSRGMVTQLQWDRFTQKYSVVRADLMINRSA